MRTLSSEIEDAVLRMRYYGEPGPDVETLERWLFEIAQLELRPEPNPDCEDCNGY